MEKGSEFCAADQERENPLESFLFPLLRICAHARRGDFIIHHGICLLYFTRQRIKKGLMDPQISFPPPCRLLFFSRFKSDLIDYSDDEHVSCGLSGDSQTFPFPGALASGLHPSSLKHPSLCFPFHNASSEIQNGKKLHQWKALRDLPDVRLSRPRSGSARIPPRISESRK